MSYSPFLLCPPLPFAVVNVGIGLALFGQRFSRFSSTLVNIYIAWAVFFVATIVVLFLLFTVTALTSADKGSLKQVPSLHYNNVYPYFLFQDKLSSLFLHLSSHWSAVDLERKTITKEGWSLLYQARKPPSQLMMVQSHPPVMHLRDGLQQQCLE